MLTNEDKALLREIRNKAHELAGLCAKAYKRGYTARFRMNPESDQLDEFSVTTQTPVNVDES